MKKIILIGLILLSLSAFGLQPRPRNRGVSQQAIIVDKLYIDYISANRVLYTTTDGEVTSSAGFTFDGTDLSVANKINFNDGTDTSFLQMIQEDGLGERLTFGLDEDTRSLVLCDFGDTGEDLGLTAFSDPTLYLVAADKSEYTYLTNNGSTFNIGSTCSKVNMSSDNGAFFIWSQDVSSGNIFQMSGGSNDQLIDTDGEQSVLAIYPQINQSGTAAVNCLHIKTDETEIRR